MSKEVEKEKYEEETRWRRKIMRWRRRIMRWIGDILGGEGE